MKKLLLAITFLSLVLTASAQNKCEVKYMPTADFKTKIWNLQGTEWHFLGKSPVVIDFYTTWCGPCKRLAPIMEELAKEYCGKVTFYKIDIEKEPEIAQKFGIHSIPTLMFIPASGTPGLLQGLRDKEELKGVIDKHALKQ